MSEEKIPAGLEAIANAANVVDPQYQFARFVKKNGGAIEAIENLEYRWTLWLQNAPRQKPEAQSSMPEGETRTKRRARELQESILEAQRLDPQKSIGIAACAEILAKLDAIPRDVLPSERIQREVHERHDDDHDDVQGDPFAGLGLP